MLRILLYYRMHDGSWHPMYGPLSSPLGGVIILAGFLAGTGAIVIHAYRKMKSGRPEYIRALLWSLSTWVVIALHVLPHAYAKGTPEYSRPYWAMTVSTALWVAYGFLRAIPLLNTPKGPKGTVETA